MWKGKVSQKTLFNWIKLRKETGGFEIKERPKVRSTPCLRKECRVIYLETHPDHFLIVIGGAVRVTAASVFNALRKFGITRKRNDPLQRARRDLGADISNSIEKLENDDLGYLDESGRVHFRDRQGWRPRNTWFHASG